METLIFSIKFFIKFAGIVAVNYIGIESQSIKDNSESKSPIPTEIVYQKQDTVLNDTLNINLNALVRSVEIDESQSNKMG